MDHIFIFSSAFFTVFLSLLLLLNKVHLRFKKIVVVFSFLFFFIFLFNLSTSKNLRNTIQELRVNLDSNQSIDKKIVETLEKKQEQPVKVEDVQLLKEHVIMDIPVVSQLPELPRGCEVTSLAMLLQSAGVNVEKIELAKQIKKDPTLFQIRNGQVFFGHPNVGFIGDMYNRDNAGYGVYHKPIKELADEYLPTRTIDLTGREFKELEASLSNGFPVWVIINTRYKELPPEEFRTWNTPIGEVQITYREHSALITGYDKDYVYVNDPLTVEKNKKVPKKDFIDAWIQMGSQAITYINL